MSNPKLNLEVLSEKLAVCRLPADAQVPKWAWSDSLSSVTRTGDELSVVCAEGAVPNDVTRTPGWRAIKVRGPLDFDLVGILARLSEVLAQAGVSIFAISTYDTDHILVRDTQLDAAVKALNDAGHEVDS